MCSRYTIFLLLIVLKNSRSFLMHPRTSSMLLMAVHRVLRILRHLHISYAYNLSMYFTLRVRPPTKYKSNDQSYYFTLLNGRANSKWLQVSTSLNFRTAPWASQILYSIPCVMTIPHKTLFSSSYIFPLVLKVLHYVLSWRF